MYLLAVISDIFGYPVAIEIVTALHVPTQPATNLNCNTLGNQPRSRQNTVGVIWRGLAFWVKLRDDRVVYSCEL